MQLYPSFFALTRVMTTAITSFLHSWKITCVGMPRDWRHDREDQVVISGEQREMARVAFATAIMLALIPAAAAAKDTQFWNLTANTITSLQLSSPGKNEWSRNQA